MAEKPSVYDAFIDELTALQIGADFSAVRVVGIATRAVKRAQLVVDGELAPINQRGNVAELARGSYIN